jgi:hypothetical protein
VIPELEKYDTPLAGVEQRMTGWVEEALELRHGAAEDPDGTLDGILLVIFPDEVIHALQRVRARSDRVDGLLANITRARGRLRRMQANAKFEAERAYAEAASRGLTHRVDFSSAKERDSNARLDSFEQERVAHHAAQAVAMADECYEVIRDISWQLNGMRTELRAVLNALQMESSLER